MQMKNNLYFVIIIALILSFITLTYQYYFLTLFICFIGINESTKQQNKKRKKEAKKYSHQELISIYNVLLKKNSKISAKNPTNRGDKIC